MFDFPSGLRSIGHVVAGLSLVLGLAGCPPPRAADSPPLSPYASSGCTADTGAVTSTWNAYRASHPFHAQEVAISEPLAGGCRILVLSEPPPGVTTGSLAEVHPGLGALVSKKHVLGSDGWTEDLVGILPPMDDDELADLSSRLHVSMFGTAYRSRLAPIAAPSSWKGPLDIEVRPAELHEWVFGPEASFWPLDGGTAERADDLLTPAQTGVYVSRTPGIVLWSFPKRRPFEEQRANVRIFGVESDLVLGAVGDDDTVLVIGRERVAPVERLPPLRFESVEVLAKTSLGQLAQSYERLQLFAGSRKDGGDWAPILLSPMLLDTEIGSVLNIADQMLKRWSMNLMIDYERFDYPGEPASGPFHKSIADELGAGTLTFNWNTTGTGALAQLQGGKSLYWMHRTGALHVSYLPGDRPDARAEVYEDAARSFFAQQADPYLVRAVQYTALFQAFRQLGVTTSDPVADIEAAIGATPENDTLRRAGIVAFQRLLDVSDSELGEAAARFVALDLGNVDQLAERELQKALARIPSEYRAQMEARIRENAKDKLRELIDEIKAERARKLLKNAQALRFSMMPGREEAPRHLATALVHTTMVDAAGTQPLIWAELTAHLGEQAARARAGEIGAAAVFLKKHGLNLDAAGDWREVAAALADVEAIEKQYRESTARDTKGRIHTPSVVHSSGAKIGVRGGHNVGSKVASVKALVRPADLARVTVGRSGASLAGATRVVRARPDALRELATRPALPGGGSGGVRPAPPRVPDAGWARLPEHPSFGCGSRCIVIKQYSEAAPGVDGVLRSRFKIDVDGTVSRASSVSDVTDQVVRNLERQARLGAAKSARLDVVIRDADVTLDKAMATADSTRSALAMRKVNADLGFVVDRTDGAALLADLDLTRATVSEPVRQGGNFVFSVTVPQNPTLGQRVMMRVFGKGAPPAQVDMAGAVVPSATRKPADIARELRQRFGKDTLLELHADANPTTTDNEPRDPRSHHAGTSSHTF